MNAKMLDKIGISIVGSGSSSGEITMTKVGLKL